jgi:hypothetical protein
MVAILPIASRDTSCGTIYKCMAMLKKVAQAVMKILFEVLL